jgi:xylan 1,4-beta-xylosidase
MRCLTGFLALVSGGFLIPNWSHAAGGDSGAGALPRPERVISADLNSVAGPHSKAFRLAVGAGRAEEALQPEWQRQLQLAHEELGFEYLRCHGIFHDGMGVYREDAEGRPSYDWAKVDAFLDGLKAAGMRPFVELSFMPSALALNPRQTIFHWRGITSPPKSYEKWEQLVAAFARHVTERYGRDEVARWYFEVWNEPNLPNFWSGSKQDYFKLYRHSAAALKSVDARYRVGGPATAGCAWIQDMILFCGTNGVPLDFVSTHAYGSPWKPGSYLDFGAVGRQLLGAAAQIKSSPRPDLELHFTEWNSSWSLQEPLRDTYVHAPFVLEQIKLARNAAASLPYWVFTDIFTEGGTPTRPFHGGFGLLTIDGIRKPVYHAYRLLNQLGDLELENADPHSLVCTRRGGSVQLLAWDCFSPAPTLAGPGEARTILVPPPRSKPPVRLRIAGLRPGPHTLDVFRIGAGCNDPYGEYLAAGAPPQLAEPLLGRLKTDNGLRPSESRTVLVPTDGRWAEQFALRDNDVLLVVLRPAASTP